MEVITRDISLIPSIGRLGSTIPSYNKDGEELNSGNTENYTDWGHYPMDVVLSGDILDGVSGLTHIEEGIPLNGDILRYKNMSDAYGFLKNFSHGCEYYRMIKRGGEEVWSEVSETMWDECYHLTEIMYSGDTEEKLADPFLFMSKFFVWNWSFKDTLPEMSEVTDGEKKGIAVNPSTETFLLRFRDDSGTRYENTFYNLVRWLIDNEHNPSFEGQVSYTIPYNKITFLVDSDISVTGLLRPYIEDWVPNKRKYVGDCIWYTDVSGDTKAYRLKETDDEPSDRNGKYWKGYFDSNSGIVYFDTYTNGIPDHWEECPTSGVSITQNAESTINDSYLKFMQRLRKSYDDMGNELPFNISGNTTETELRYCLGNMNTAVKDGKTTYDRLQSVTFYSSDTSSVIPFNYEENIDGIIPTSAITIESGYAEFVYNDNMSNDNSGVTHTEIYSFEKKAMSGVTIDGESKDFEYIDIDYDKTYAKNGDEFTTDYEVRSQISYSIERGGNDMSQDIPVFSDEALMGISSFKVDADVNIERGGAAAFERHHILSEVNTFEDLLNYKNNMFNL